MENSQSRSGSGTRRTTASHTHGLGLLDGELEPLARLQDSHVPQNPGEEYLGNIQPDQKPKLPWWKTPSPWWLLIITPFTAMAASSTITPRIEIYTSLACSFLRPEYGESLQQPADILGFLHTNDCRIPAVALHSSCVNFSDVFMIDKSLQTNGADAPPTRKQRCASDPVVQAAVAKLTTLITMSMGILSCITTGWWGAYSDRHGRTSVMGISVIGLLLTDFNFIMVVLFPRHIPGGYWFLVVGPMVEGVLGGMTGGVAAIHAYLADTSNESNRSRIFSLSLGLLSTGIALGPTLGGLLIRFTGQALSVFYVGGCLHLMYSCMVWFIIPESLTKGQMELAKTRYANSLRVDPDSSLDTRFTRIAQRLFSFLMPLSILGPTEKGPKGRKKDWNLTLLGVAYGFTVAMMGSYSFIFQYAAGSFGWSFETLGYWLSSVSVISAIFLTLILPIAIKILKPKPVILEFPVTPVETTPLLNSPSSSSSTMMNRKTIKREIHSPLFDLNLARASLLVHIVSYISMGLAQSPILFALSGTFNSLGAGFSPAAQSVALALYAKRGGVEIGRLFGAISLIQVISSQILAPFVYGFVYVRTVAIYPPMVFFVFAAAIGISFCILSFIRIPKGDEYHRQYLADLEESDSNEETSSRAQEST